MRRQRKTRKRRSQSKLKVLTAMALNQQEIVLKRIPTVREIQRCKQWEGSIKKVKSLLRRNSQQTLLTYVRQRIKIIHDLENQANYIVSGIIQRISPGLSLDQIGITHCQKLPWSTRSHGWYCILQLLKESAGSVIQGQVSWFSRMSPSF